MMWSHPRASPRLVLKNPRLCSPSKVMAKSSPCEFIGYFRFSTVHVPVLSCSALNRSNPPMPTCPSEEKYKSPFGRNEGNISFPGVLMGSPRLSTPPNPCSPISIRQMSRPPNPPGMSETKYSHLPSGDTVGWAKEDKVSLVISNNLGAPQLASVRSEV